MRLNTDLWPRDFRYFSPSLSYPTGFKSYSLWSWTRMLAWHSHFSSKLVFCFFFFLPTPKYEFQQVNKVKFSPLALNVSWCIQGMTCHLLSIFLYRIDFSISHFEFQPHLLGNNCLNTSSPNTFLMGFPWQR